MTIEPLLEVVVDDAAMRAAADAAFAKIDAPEAISSIEAFLCGKNAYVAAKAIVRLKAIDDPASSLVLVREAVISPWPDVRDLAAEAPWAKLAEDDSPCCCKCCC